jgi:hypothetical protein
MEENERCTFEPATDSPMVCAELLDVALVEIAGLAYRLVIAIIGERSGQDYAPHFRARWLAV